MCVGKRPFVPSMCHITLHYSLARMDIRDADLGGFGGLEYIRQILPKYKNSYCTLNCEH